ncbi:MAG: alpha/beta hydrolase [Hyphomicrobiales bacterium]|nr:alpha/beta hydrolase [Hyphomicrobiales bacterium]
MRSSPRVFCLRRDSRRHQRVTGRVTKPKYDPERAPLTLDVAGRAIACRTVEAYGAGALQPGIVWLGGFKSDMRGSKALALEDYAQAHARAFLRFDYSGHGESSGDFREGTIGRWLEESLFAFRALTVGPQIIVGSSMGGWLAMLLARELARRNEQTRIAGMVLIAPALDFTQDLMWPELPEEARRAIETEGVWLRPSEYGPEPYPLTRALFEDGRRHLLLGGEVRAHAPVHILQGMRDESVPWRHALKIVEHLAADPVVLTLIRDGDHRLSRPEDIARLIAAVEAIA